MKIVQIVTRMDDVGGAQIHVKDIASGLKNTGHDIYIITGEKESIHNEIEQNGIKLINSRNLIRKLNIISDIKAVMEIRKLIKKIEPDIIATHSSKAGTIGRVVGWSLNIPTIFTAHGWSYTDGVSRRKQWIYILIEKVMGRFSDGVITVSEYDKQLALRYKVLPESKIYKVHNGVHDIVRTKNPIDLNEPPKIIMVARFAPPKRQLQLLKALEQIRYLKWKVSFAGDGPQLQEAQDFVKSVGLEDRVAFLGNRQDITELLQKADLFALLSDWEGLPLSILEAMRCSLPIISSDVGGVKEAVIQSINGYLIPKTDNNELQKKLILMLSDSSLRLKMGEQSRQLYEEKFTFEKMFNETLLFYEKTIQAKQINPMQSSY